MSRGRMVATVTCQRKKYTNLHTMVYGTHKFKYLSTLGSYSKLQST